MADKNFNQGNQSHRQEQDWDREENRFHRDNNRQDYGNAGYEGGKGWGANSDDRRRSATGLPLENSGMYNRVNYIPDNDDDRRLNNRDYESTPYGTSGTYGYRNEDQDRYGVSGNNSRDWNNRRDYGNQSGGNSQNDWDRWRIEQSNTNRGGYYGSQNRGQQYGANDNRWDEGRRGSSAYGNTGSGYNRDWDRNRYGNNSNRQDNDWWDKTKGEVSSWFNDDDNRRNRDDDRLHRGKGPSNYRRSPDRVMEDVCDRLTDDDRVDASDISVQVDNDTVILSGTVNTRAEKRRAEDIVEAVSGVRNVENRLHVGDNVLKTHDYTGNTDKPGGIGTESGTTNEIIRDVERERKTDGGKGRTKNP